MTVLKVQPIEYPSQRLEEIAERIVRVFAPIFTDYQINRSLSAVDLNSEVLEKNDELEQLNGHHFLNFLSKYGTPILGLTSLCTVSLQRRLVLGQGRDGDLKIAYVSANNPGFDKIDSDYHVERVIAVGLHELGHTRELLHHDEVPEYTINDKLCPMTTAHRGSVSEYLSARDSTSFCQGCYNKMGIKPKSII